jgi:hypothetical protein
LIYHTYFLYTVQCYHDNIVHIILKFGKNYRNCKDNIRRPFMVENIGLYRGIHKPLLSNNGYHANTHDESQNCGTVHQIVKEHFINFLVKVISCNNQNPNQS